MVSAHLLGFGCAKLAPDNHIYWRLCSCWAHGPGVNDNVCVCQEEEVCLDSFLCSFGEWMLKDVDNMSVDYELVG